MSCDCSVGLTRYVTRAVKPALIDSRPRQGAVDLRAQKNMTEPLISILDIRNYDKT
jgi:hypothetical protein